MGRCFLEFAVVMEKRKKERRQFVNIRFIGPASDQDFHAR